MDKTLWGTSGAPSITIPEPTFHRDWPTRPEFTWSSDQRAVISSYAGAGDDYSIGTLVSRELEEADTLYDHFVIRSVTPYWPTEQSGLMIRVEVDIYA